MELLVPAAAGALVAVPAIVAMYFLKIRGPEVPVASFVLWARHLADRQANAPWKRLRLSALLLVQLLVAVAVAFALMRPGVSSAGGVATTTVVLLDGSPSMRATDVEPSRFEAAVAKARARVDRLGAGDQLAVVLLGGNAQLLAAPTGDRSALHDALGKARPGGEAANLEEGVSVANGVLGGRPGGSVVLYSDGHARAPATPPALAAPLRYESVGTSSANVAVEALGRTPTGEVFVRVTNAGRTGRDLQMEMRADGRLVDVLPARVPGGSTEELVWPRLPAGTAALEARVTPGDDLPIDDAAWLVTAPPATRRVLVVTAGNGFLTRALDLRPDLEITVVDPGAYKPGGAGERYDLTVFDGFVPPGALPQPTLVVNPPQGSGPVPAGPPIDPGGLLPADPREPLLSYVSLRDVHVQSASSVTPPADWRTVIAATNGPLLLVHQGEPRIAQLTFDLHRSDLPLRAAFPILVQNLLGYLLPGSFESQVLPLGQPVRVTADADVSRVRVTTPGGRPLYLHPPFPGTVEDTSEPGVYTVRETRPGGERTSRFVLQLQDPGQSRIAPGEPPQVVVGGAVSGEAPRSTLELWPWLVALVLIGLGVEWVVFLRG